EGRHLLFNRLGRTKVEIPHHGRRRLLRARRERPCRRAAEKCDELAALHHSITSSAMATRVAGTSIFRAFAVLRFMTNSNRVDCTTGRSAAFSPLRIRPT